jgi:eukaryotic-like serine/threonine-protein kinase
MAQRSDNPRELLFGLLALQTGMINQAQLVAAFHAWTLDRSRGMAGVLVAQGAVDEDGRALLKALTEKHLKMYGGDPEKSLAAVDVGRSTRENLNGIGDPEIDATVSRLGSGTEDDGDPDRTATFRVVRPHARGGLGAVFVALDEELHREVALKQIHDRHADDPGSRARFLFEAEVTGGLEHPGSSPSTASVRIPGCGWD